jgi:Rrf2 family protein
MRITAKVDYAVRACIELAMAFEADGAPVPVKGHDIAAAQDIPVKFLENILSELKRSGIVASRRGAEGGYWLAQPPTEVSVADIIRAVEGPLADVRGVRPDQLDFGPELSSLQRMWIAVRANLRTVLENVTLAGLCHQELPKAVDALADDPDAWAAH